MQKGLEYMCGHGLDERGTPYAECNSCREKTSVAIETWLADKRTKKMLLSGQLGF